MFKTYVVLAVIVVMTVAGDFTLKLASGRPSPFVSFWFLQGAVFYALTAIGWVILMQSHSLAQIGVLYSSMTILALTSVGYTFFNEAVSPRQIAGVSAAIFAIFLVEY